MRLRYVFLILIVLTLGACKRQFYRIDADRESYGILADKSANPEWSIPPFELERQPESRLYDDAPADCPPLPPDDPAAHLYMHCADCKKGYPHWHRNGVAVSIEPQAWEAGLFINDDGSLMLSPTSSIDLALLNSREYQTELENVYFSALALSLERFQFDLQWFGRNTTQYEHFGKRPNERNTLTTDSNLGFNRAFAGGGQLLVDFANSFVWEFTGTGSHLAISNLAVRFVQPLLRGAFRDVAMESLTQSERDVLYDVRGFARFRKQFYFNLVSGNDGYLSLLLLLQGIRNLEANLTSLEYSLQTHEALSEAGIVSPVQVDQVFQSYQTGRLRLIQAQNRYENELDKYKLRLGIPPTQKVHLDDSQLRPFELSDGAVEELQRDCEALVKEFRELETPPSSARMATGISELSDLRDRFDDLAKNVNQELQEVKSQPHSIPADDEARQQRAWEAGVHERLQTRLAELRKDRDQIDNSLNDLSRTYRENSAASNGEEILDLIEQTLTLSKDLYVVQVQIRAFFIQLEPVQYNEREALDIAFSSRLDLMNTRGQVVDAWRKINLAADGLESDLDVILEADIATKPGTKNPLKFSSEASSLRTGLSFDGPLNRKAERNIYRASLVSYQRARRAFMERSDQIAQAVRQDLRQLHADRLNFEIARQSLIVAARQVEQAQDELLAPGKAASDSSLTQDVLNALDSLLDAKNELIGIWVRYETSLLQLKLDLESLQLDDRGLMINEHESSDEAGNEPRIAPER